MIPRCTVFVKNQRCSIFLLVCICKMHRRLAVSLHTNPLVTTREGLGVRVQRRGHRLYLDCIDFKMYLVKCTTCIIKINVNIAFFPMCIF